MTEIRPVSADSHRIVQSGPVPATILRSLGRTLGAKAVSLPVAGVTTLLATRTVVDSLGVSGYALFALATTLPALVPSDIGTLSAIVNAMAESREADFTPFRRTIVSTARLLTFAGAFSAVVGIAPACLGAWSSLLGHRTQPGSDAAVAVAFLLFGCNLPLSLGISTLIALNRTHLAMLVQMAGSLLSLGLIQFTAIAYATTASFVASRLLGQCLAGAVCLWLAGRCLGVPVFGLVAGSVLPRHPGTYIRHLVGPAAVVNFCFAVAYSTDRLVLSHAAGDRAVAAYSAGANLFTPATALVSATGLPLWSLFARQRDAADRSSRADVARLTRYFTTGGVILGAGLVLLGPAIGGWMTHGQAEVDLELMTAFAALLTVQAACQPVGMWLTDAAGLRFQARRAGVMAAVNLALSIPLAHLIGAPGPVVGSLIALTVIVFVPNYRRAGRSSPGSPDRRRDLVAH
jgi:O-antigen/teichoic acid export membrane protein